MFKKLQELRQQKAQAVEQMREMLANADKENRSLNEEEGGKFDALKAKVDELKTEIERLETVTEEERSNDLPPKSWTKPPTD
ncbi:phage major capsid protein [Mannheimia indoligenes]|uniref:phage major capsid protein n=1 Tax=Mannheimia indoligenes TaxID=3103145 RepID=UPI002FE60B61